MMILLTWIFFVLMCVSSIVALPFAALWVVSIVGGGAPFVPVPKEAVDQIVEALCLGQGGALPVHRKKWVVYDMGCGDGRVLLAAYKKYPHIEAVGIEKALLPYLIAKWRTRGTSIKIIRGDMFAQDVSDATHVVTYLFPEMMERVEQKLTADLKPGARLVTIDFPLPNRIGELLIATAGRGSSLTVYEF